MWSRLAAGAAVLGAGSLLAACGTTSVAPRPDGTGTPALNASVTLSVVACEPRGLCIAAGSNPTAAAAATSLEVSRGGSGAWSAAAVPDLTGVTLAAGSCWGSGCLLGGTGPSGSVVLIVNPLRRVSSTTSSRPPGSGISALDCTAPGRCIALVATTTDTAVFETTDSGQSWRQLSSLPASLTAATSLSCATPRECVAAGTGPRGAAAARSTDGGVRWVVSGKPGGLQVFTSVACGVSRRCLATARRTSGSSELLRSTNGGISFSALATHVPAPGATACTTTALCVVGGGGPDGGALSSYVALRAESPRRLAFVPDAIIAVACATVARCSAVTQASTVSFVP